MKKIFAGACLLASVTFALPASATLVEFDVGGALMEDAVTGDLYSPVGTFRFDTDTLAVSDVSVNTIFNTYINGAYDAGTETFGLFAVFSPPLGTVLDLSISFTELLDSISGLGVGDSFWMGVDPYEHDNETHQAFGYGIDPSLSGRVLASVPAPSPVPLPAGLPLLLAGLGGLGLLRRKRTS